MQIWELIPNDAQIMRVDFIKAWHSLDYDWLAINGEIKIANCNGNLNMCPIGMISRAQGSIDHHISQQSCNERAYRMQMQFNLVHMECKIAFFFYL